MQSWNNNRSADFSPQEASDRTSGRKVQRSTPFRALLRTEVRAYSSAKVIHRWRGGLPFSPPQPPVNNFGGGSKIYCEKLPQFGSIEGLGTQGPEDEFRALTLDVSPETFALRPCALSQRNTQNLSPASANWQRRTSISVSIRQGPRAQQDQTNKTKP